MQPNRPPGQRAIIILLCITVATIFLAGTLYSQAEPAPNAEGIINDPNVMLLTATPTPSGPTQPTLAVQDGLITSPGASVSVPIHFTDGGIDNINVIVFSVQFDPICLAFDGRDSNEDGIPDAVGFNGALPASSAKAVSLDDLANGQIHFVIADFYLQNYLTSLASLVSATFQTSCTPTGTERETVVSLINSSIGTSNASHPIEPVTVDGVITIRQTPTITPTPTMLCGFGSATTQDTNGTDVIAAPLCTVTVTQPPTPTPSSTPTMTPTMTPTTTPTPSLSTLSIPSNIWVEINSRVTVPIEYQSGNQAVSAMAFSIDYEQECLAFDATDQNGDGIPDDIQFAAPLDAFTISVNFDAADTDGELDFVIFDAAPPLAALPNLDPLVEIEFTTEHCVSTGHYRVAPINFSLASFGDLAGREVPGHTVNGSVTVVYPTPTPSPTATVLYCPTLTPIPLWVEPVTSPTTELSQLIAVYNATGISWIEVETQSGTFRGGGNAVTITLLPNTVHTLQVTVGVHVSGWPGCPPIDYTLRTSVDRTGNPLIIEQISSPPTAEAIYLSSTSGGRLVDGARTRFADEDIVVYLPASEEWLLFFDGSDVGLRKTDIDAFAFDPATGDLLLSLDVPVRIPTIGWVDDSDIVAFTPTQLGEQTAGEFRLYWDGSAHDLASNSEDVDALAFADLETGTPKLVISTIGVTRVGPGNDRYSDADLLLLDPATDTWDFYVDGSAVGLTKGSEDISSAWIDGDKLYLSTKGSYVVNSLNQQRGDGNEILRCERASPSGCLFGRYWLGAEHGFRRENIDALAFGALDRTLLTGLHATATADDVVADFEVDLREESAAAEGIDNFDLMQPDEDEEVFRYQLWLPEIQR